MQNKLTFTLIGDGSSDKALINIIKWLLNDKYPKLSIVSQFADFRGYRNPPRRSDILAQIEFARIYFPFDMIIYHRDAEQTDRNFIDIRKREIFDSIIDNEMAGKIVSIVPIVMMESWLLFDEASIKKVAENKNYSNKIDLPALSQIEEIRDSKNRLHELLKTVSCKKKRSLKNFNVKKAVHLVADNITDFSPLRNLYSFRCFERDLDECILKLKPKFFFNEIQLQENNVLEY